MISMERPPSTYEGLTSTGKPIRFAARIALSTVKTMSLSGCLRSSFLTISLNRSRSSARSMASGEVPRMVTPSFHRLRARFSGVWPPNCTITPTGLSVLTTCSTSSNVRGSK